MVFSPSFVTALISPEGEIFTERVLVGTVTGGSSKAPLDKLMRPCESNLNAPARV